MSLNFPPFYNRNEFGVLHPDLRVVKYGLKLEALQEVLSQAEVERDSVLEQYRSSDTVVKELLLGLMTDAIGHQDEDSRKKALRHYLDTYKSLLSAGIRNANHPQVKQIILNLLLLYPCMNYDTFGSDFAAVVSADDEKLSKQVSDKEAAVAQAQRAVQSHLNKIGRVFSNGVPENWEGISGPTTAEIIVKSFMARWRSRASMFEVPVTVSGVGIHTMEPNRRTVWDEAYKNMQLDAKTKRPIYRYVTEPKIGSTGPVKEEAGLPVMFSPETKE